MISYFYFKITLELADISESTVLNYLKIKD